MLKLLDFFFISFHTILILFNMFGWIFRKTRKLNLIVLLITGASWFLLGIFYGIGYCPLTDWHFNILERMGETNLPTSYIAYIMQRLTGISYNEKIVDTATMAVYVLSLGISLYVNFRNRLKARG